MLVDTHAHIYLEQFDKDIDEVIERSISSGVKKIYLPNIDHTSIDRMLSLVEKNRELCFPMMGLHPCSVNSNLDRDLAEVETWLGKGDFAGIGETGIDLYWDKTYYQQQVEALKIQIGWAKEYSLPIILHCRDSIQETIDLVSAQAGDDLTGIFHCFTGTCEQAKEIISFGFKLGIGGVVTFKNSKLDEVIKAIGINHIVLETDSPYLSPDPRRGKRNEPSNLGFIVKKLTEITGISEQELRNITTRNASELF